MFQNSISETLSPGIGDPHRACPNQLAVDARLALGVEPVPAEPRPQVARVDPVEPDVRVDVLDPRADVERVVVLLALLLPPAVSPPPARPLSSAVRSAVAETILPVVAGEVGATVRYTS